MQGKVPVHVPNPGSAQSGWIVELQNRIGTNETCRSTY